MKTLRQLYATLILVLAISFSAFAGQMDTGFTNPPPPPPSSQMATTGDMSTTLEGQMDTPLAGDMTTGVTAKDSTLLNLLQSVLSIF